MESLYTAIKIAFSFIQKKVYLMKVYIYGASIIGGYIATQLIKKGIQIYLENQFALIANHLLPTQSQKGASYENLYLWSRCYRWIHGCSAR